MQAFQSLDPVEEVQLQFPLRRSDARGFGQTVLTGQLPFQWNGATQYVSVQVAVSHSSGGQNSVDNVEIHVLPSPAAGLAATSYLDAAGRVAVPFNRFSESLSGYLQRIAGVFSREPPLQMGSAPQHLAGQQILQELSAFGKFVDVSNAFLRSFRGLLPIVFRGRPFNIPIRIDLPQDFPRRAPAVYVEPTPQMAFVDGAAVNPVSGAVVCGALSQWCCPPCTLTTVLKELQSQFSALPPVRGRPAAPPAAATTSAAGSSTATPLPRSSQQCVISDVEPLEQKTTHASPQPSPAPVAAVHPPATGTLPSADEGKCVICIDEPAQWAAVPCGHKAMCAECGKKIMQTTKRCPVCRQSIAQLIHIFD